MRYVNMMLRTGASIAAGAALATTGAAQTQTQTQTQTQAGRITGVGGIFVKSKDAKALAAWYRDVLGVQMEAFGGAMLRYDAPGQPPLVVWRAFKRETKYMEPSARDFMINFTIDDMDAFVARLKAKNVPILERDDAGGNGRFAWILDPDGTKIELWQPQTDK